VKLGYLSSTLWRVRLIPPRSRNSTATWQSLATSTPHHTSTNLTPHQPPKHDKKTWTTEEDAETSEADPAVVVAEVDVATTEAVHAAADTRARKDSRSASLAKPFWTCQSSRTRLLRSSSMAEGRVGFPPTRIAGDARADRWTQWSAS
jgi:hypothetical protein